METMEFKKKCIDCDADVQFDGSDQEYNGFGPCRKHPGKHRVEGVIFYHSGALDIQDQRDRRKFSPQITLVPGREKIDPVSGARLVAVKPLMVQFFDGKYETEDPEVQFYLYANRQCATGPEGERMWREIYLNESQRNAILDAENKELEAKHRKLREEVSMLEQVKANTKAGKAASV